MSDRMLVISADCHAAARWEDYEKYFERALRIFEMLGSRLAMALTELEFGMFLGLLEESGKAREMLQRASETFQDLGTVSELEQARRELKEIGLG